MEFYSQVCVAARVASWAWSCLCSLGWPQCLLSRADILGLQRTNQTHFTAWETEASCFSVTEPRVEPALCLRFSRSQFPYL